MKEIFADIFQKNFWKSTESVSGPGSTMKATKNIRRAIPILVEEYGFNSILDIPCGDFQWAQQMALDMGIGYITADIVPELIEQNRAKYPGKEFLVLDITKNDLPYADMILVRDLFVHFSDADIKRSLQNIRRAGIPYLLTTTFPDVESEVRIETGQWRPVNMASFHGLPDPRELIADPAGHPFESKSLGLWQMGDYVG